MCSPGTILRGRAALPQSDPPVFICSPCAVACLIHSRTLPSRWVGSVEVICKGTAIIRHAETGIDYPIHADELDWDTVERRDRSRGKESRHVAVIGHPELGLLAWVVVEYPVGVPYANQADVGPHILLSDFDFQPAEPPDEDGKEPAPSFNIFITHEPQNAPIARVLADQLRTWGVPKDTIRSSSERERVSAHWISEVDLFLVIHTGGDEDWAIPTWELHMATSNETQRTSVVVFQFTDERPLISMEYTLIDLRVAVACQKFVYSFHRIPSFVVPEANRNKANDEFFSALGDTALAVVEMRASAF